MELAYEEEEVIVPFLDVARLPKKGDNVAIAIDVIPEGTCIRLLNGSLAYTSHTILEGHRFAVERIYTNEGLYSWNMQFGTALKDIFPGDYIMNERGRAALQIVDPIFKWPSEANFDDRIISYKFDEDTFLPAPTNELVPNFDKETFMGYKRGSIRGVGTRNYVVVFSVSSLCNGVVKKVTADSQGSFKRDQPNFDGIVCCPHTEGSIDSRSNNRDKYLRTLSGLFVHPNVGAGVIVFNEEDEIQRPEIEAAIQQQGIDLNSLSLTWISLQSLQFSLTSLIEAIQQAVDVALSSQRSVQPVSSLCLALQCGGSDAFSGVTANPLQGAVAEYVILRGGSAVLAETDELIGADSYILHRVASREVVKEFQAMQAHYEAEANIHGVSAQANPSGGNFYRGLYNIALKSLGAAMKKPEDIRLEGVLKYSERINNRCHGYYFMDSPGNDIESVTGQVAGGCNIIMFSTGNGSITNFPFVPTVKLLTTSKRYHRLAKDLDINAGEYLNGKPLYQLTRETYQYVHRVAEGYRTFGERAGHSQIQIWRNWYCQNEEDYKKKNEVVSLSDPHCPSLSSCPQYTYSALHYKKESHDCYVARSGIVVFPTSLCSGQIAGIISKKIQCPSLSFSSALIHTEGCGEGYGVSEQDGIHNYDRIAVGHLLHPFTRIGYLVEHGCEKTLLTYFESVLRSQYKTDINQFGQGSVQKEGGIENTVNHAVEWINEKASELSIPEVVKNIPLTGLIFGFTSTTKQMSEASVQSLIQCFNILLGNKCILVIPENDPILNQPLFCSHFYDDCLIRPTLLNGDCIKPEVTGVIHIMRSQSPRDYNETVTSLAATGASMIIHFSNSPIVYPGHPFVPVFRMTERESVNADGFMKEDTEKIMQRIVSVLSREEETISMKLQYSDFQILRTASGYSL